MIWKETTTMEQKIEFSADQEIIQSQSFAENF